jgi:hypothetical protein
MKGTKTRMTAGTKRQQDPGHESNSNVGHDSNSRKRTGTRTGQEEKKHESGVRAGKIKRAGIEKGRSRTGTGQ